MPSRLCRSSSLVLQVLPDKRIQRRERLVHQEDVGIGGKRPGKPDPLLHATGKLVHVPVAPAVEIHQLEVFPDNGVAFRPGSAPQLEAEADVLMDGAPGQQGELLEHHGDALRAHAPQRGGIAARHVERGIPVADQDLAAGDPAEAVHGAQQGRLAGARQTHEYANLAALHRERCAGNTDDRAGGVLDALPVGAAIEHLQGSRYVATKQDVDCLQLDRVNGSAPLLGAAARLAQAIEQEGDDDDGEPGLGSLWRYLRY